MKNLNLKVIIPSVILLAGIYFLSPIVIEREIRQAGQGTDIKLSTASMSKITTSSTLAQQLLDTNTSRSYAVISNPSDTGVYLTLGATTTAAYLKGIWVPAGGRYELNGTNLWTGKVSVSTTTAGKNVTAVEAY